MAPSLLLALCESISLLRQGGPPASKRYHRKKMGISRFSLCPSCSSWLLSRCCCRHHGGPGLDSLLGRVLLLLQGGKVPIHGLPGELGARHHRIFLQGALDLAVGVGLVEEGDAISIAKIVGRRVRRRLDAMNGGPETVIAPGHEEVATVCH